MISSGDVAIAAGDRFQFCGFPDSLIGLPWCLILEGAITPLEASPPAWGVTQCRSTGTPRVHCRTDCKTDGAGSGNC